MDGVGNGGNGGGGGDEGMVYREAKRNIPLDDRGIDEQRALEHIQGILAEALAHPSKVLGVVFAIAMEDDAKVTVPNGEVSASFLAIAGAAQWDYVLVLNLLGRLQELHGEGEPEDV